MEEAQTPIVSDNFLAFMQTTLQSSMCAWLEMLTIKVVNKHMHMLTYAELLVPGNAIRTRRLSGTTSTFGVQRTIEVTDEIATLMPNTLKQMVIDGIAPIVFFVTHPQSLPCVFSPRLTIAIDRSKSVHVVGMVIVFHVLREEFCLPELSFAATDAMQAFRATMIRKGVFIAPRTEEDFEEWQIAATCMWHPSLWVEHMRRYSTPPNIMSTIVDEFEQTRATAMASAHPLIRLDWRVAYDESGQFHLLTKRSDAETPHHRLAIPLSDMFESIAAKVRVLRRAAKSQTPSDAAMVAHTSDAPSTDDPITTLVPQVGELSLSVAAEQ